MLGSKASFTAGQVLNQDRKVPKDSLQGVLNDSEMNVVNNILKGGD